MARKPAPEPPAKAWTPDSIRAAMRKLRRRLTDVEAFNPQQAKWPSDPQVSALEISLRETVADVFGRNSRSYRNYQLAASLDTNGGKMDGKYIDGLAHGKERSINLLKSAIRFFEEKMEDDFPGEPLDQVALSARTTIASTGSANPGASGVQGQGVAGTIRVSIQND